MFKRMSIVLVGPLKKELERNEQMRISKGMKAAFNLINEIQSMSVSDAGSAYIDSIFHVFSRDRGILYDAFDQSKRITVELSIVFGSDVIVKFSFLKSFTRIIHI